MHVKLLKKRDSKSLGDLDLIRVRSIKMKKFSNHTLALIEGRAFTISNNNLNINLNINKRRNHFDRIIIGVW